MTVSVRVLDSADAEAWAHRVPARLLVGAQVLTAIAVIAATVAGGGTPAATVSDVDSADRILWYLVLGIAAGCAGTAFFAPRLTFWPGAAAGAGAIAIAPAATTPWLAALVTATLAIGGADALTRTRRRALAGTWSADAPAVRIDAGRQVARTVLRPRLRRLAIGAAATLLSLAALGLALHDDAAAGRFREHALVAGGVVVPPLDEDAMNAHVRIEGQVYDVYLETITAQVGDALDVRYDPATGRAEPVGDVFDPWPALIPAGFGATAGLSLLGAELTRRRTRRRLLDPGARPVRALADTDARIVSIHAADDRRTILGAWRGGDWSAADAGNSDGADAGEAGARGVAGAEAGGHPAHAHPDAGAEADADDEVPVAALSDDDLLAIGAAQAAAAAAARAPGGPRRTRAPEWVHWQDEPVTVLGLDGDAIAVRSLGGGPWLWLDDADHAPRRAGRAGPGGRPTIPAPRPGGAWARFWAAADDRAAAAAQATGRWAPAAMLPVLFAVAHWLAPEANVFQALWFALGALTLCSAWAGKALPVLSLSPRGIAHRAMVFVWLVPWALVRSVAADATTLAVRVRNDNAEGGEDALILTVDRRTPPILRDAPTPPAAAAAIEAARRGAAPEPSDAVRRIGLAVPSVVGLLAAVAVLAGFGIRW